MNRIGIVWLAGIAIVVIAIALLVGRGSFAIDNTRGSDPAGTVAYYGNAKGYLALPATGADNAKRPAVILIHEWWGLNEDMKMLADRFAAQGYVALAADLYGEGKVAATTTEAQAFAGAVRDNTDEAFKNLEAAVAYLTARLDVDGERLASVGWCFGGGWAYQMAVNDLGTKASVMYYGQFDPEDDFENMRAHILGHFGEDDASIKVDTVREFRAALARASGEHEVYIYPDAGHGFANERGGNNPAYKKEASDLLAKNERVFIGSV
ncbi:dienelactone hydrolase family protein [Candidatus Kaiserbacteria bacterium]|nr:dienelactone hydrolase family protein [Candidatus Kaiserbacteria bacterium]